MPPPPLLSSSAALSFGAALFSRPGRRRRRHLIDCSRGARSWRPPGRRAARNQVGRLSRDESNLRVAEGALIGFAGGRCSFRKGCGARWAAPKQLGPLSGELAQDVWRASRRCYDCQLLAAAAAAESFARSALPNCGTRLILLRLWLAHLHAAPASPFAAARNFPAGDATRIAEAPPAADANECPLRCTAS